MEFEIREAKARLSELVRCDQSGGIDFEKLEAARRRLGITGEGEGWPEAYNNPAFSRRVLGLDDGAGE